MTFTKLALSATAAILLGSGPTMGQDKIQVRAMVFDFLKVQIEKIEEDQHGYCLLDYVLLASSEGKSEIKISCGSSQKIGAKYLSAFNILSRQFVYEMLENGNCKGQVRDISREGEKSPSAEILCMVDGKLTVPASTPLVVDLEPPGD